MDLGLRMGATSTACVDAQRLACRNTHEAQGANIVRLYSSSSSSSHAVTTIACHEKYLSVRRKSKTNIACSTCSKKRNDQRKEAPCLTTHSLVVVGISLFAIRIHYCSSTHYRARGFDVNPSLHKVSLGQNIFHGTWDIDGRKDTGFPF